MTDNNSTRAITRVLPQSSQPKMAFPAMTDKEFAASEKREAARRAEHRAFLIRHGYADASTGLWADFRPDAVWARFGKRISGF